MLTGILIGLIIFGLLLIVANQKNARTDNGAVAMTTIGLFCFIIGVSGLTGLWLS